MADSKSMYSDDAEDYVDVRIYNSDIDKGRYERSKERERLHNDDWLDNKVDLNKVVNRFTPEDKVGHTKGVKYIFENSRYSIKADMASGYLRIYDKRQKCYLRIDGKPGNLKETHFKIKRREEM